MNNLSNLKKLYEQVLFTQVRVKTNKGGGSGTVIYSKAKEQTYSTYVITCFHVIDNALTLRTEYDPKIGMDWKKEYRQVINVEFFDYASVPHGRRPVNNSVDADILAYDKTHDMALLKLRTITKANTVAKMLPQDEIQKIQIGNHVHAVGCALLHDPILTEGMITHMGDEIDYNDYWMSSAQIIFGNSGGAMFLDKDDEHYFIGIPSRIDISGWSGAVTHLGYFSPITRVYKFLEDENFQFIYDEDYTEEQCEKMREEIKKKARQRAFPPVEEDNVSYGLVHDE